MPAGEIERASPIEAIEATSRKAKALLSKLTVEDDMGLDGATLVPTATTGLAAKARTMALEIEARNDLDEKGRGQGVGRQAYLPTPAPSSTASTPAAMRDALVLPPVTGVLDQTGAELGGRERRVRKSINYAEPKLNTCVDFTFVLFHRIDC